MPELPTGLPDHEGDVGIDGKCWIKLKTPMWETGADLRSYLSSSACKECRDKWRGMLDEAPPEPKE